MMLLFWLLFKKKKKKNKEAVSECFLFNKTQEIAQDGEDGGEINHETSALQPGSIHLALKGLNDFIRLYKIKTVSWSSVKTLKIFCQSRTPKLCINTPERLLVEIGFWFKDH